jgi:energy-coupling factor transporter ATP-binding protein EcfA2
MERHTTLGRTTGGNPLSLSLQDRLRHMAIIGATGSGKSTLLRHIAAQDIERGDGLLLLDPHGDLADAVLGDVPPSRHNHVCYLNLADLAYPVGLNVLEDPAPDDRARAVDGVVSAMRSIWFDSWGPRMELILRHACTALVETQNASLILLPRLLTDDAFRTRVVDRISNHEARAFFGMRFEKWRDTFRDEAIDPVLNKVEAFLAFPSIKNILGQGRSTLHLSHAMEHSRIVIANLATGVVGETAARLFGALLLANVRTAAMARASTPPSERRPFHLIADEAHSFGAASISQLLSETRKFGLSIVLVTQFLDALADTTRAALLGNAGTLVVYRCGPGDAQILSRYFGRPHQAFNAWALQSLEDGYAMISAPGNEPAMVEIEAPSPAASTEKVKRQSRRHYGRRRSEVEDKITRVLAYPSNSSSTGSTECR